MAICIGVDFDTLYMMAAYYDGQRFALVQDSEGEARIPTVLACISPGHELVGRDALEWAKQRLGQLVIAPDRLLKYQLQGRLDLTHAVGRFLTGFAASFTVRNGEITFQLGEQAYVPQIACTRLLQALKTMAERQFWSKADTCMLTVPALVGNQRPDIWNRIRKHLAAQVQVLQPEGGNHHG